MKLSFNRWKMIFCLYLALAAAVMPGSSSACGRDSGYKMETEGSSLAVSIPAEHEKYLCVSHINKIVCTPKNMTIHGYIGVRNAYVGGVRTNRKPAGVEIYRARLQTNGGKGKFERVGVCKKFRKGKKEDGLDRWNFIYRDSAVEPGRAYIYQCRGYRKEEGVKKYQERKFGTRKAAAANTVGKYQCRIARNTQKQLVVKLTGTDKKNGPLEGYVDDRHCYSVFLLCKNSGEKDTVKNLAPQAYSYDGKKWYRKPNFCIRGKESVYLRFRGNDLGVSGYQQVQMMLGYMRYNLCPWRLNDITMPQLRFNLVTGEAKTGHFIK